MRLLLAVIAVVLPARAFAGCEDPQALLQRAFPAATDTSDGMIVTGDYAQRIKPEDVACKAWPSRPELILLAVPLLEADSAEEGEVRGDVEVIVADGATGKPLARRRERGMAYADAIQFTGVEIDTARYDIRPGVRAFGVVTRQFGSSMANPYSERALWLYSLDDGRLDRVLDGVVTLQLNAENDGNCTGAGTEITRTVGIASAEHEGHRDLIVDQTETNTLSTPDSDDCQSTEVSRKTTRLTLQFDAGRYRPSAALGNIRLFSYIEIAKDP